MEHADDTLPPSPTEPEQHMPWLDATTRPKLQHPSDLVNRLILQHPSDSLTYHPIRSKSNSSGNFNFLEARQNTAVSPSRELTAESTTMSPPSVTVTSPSRAHSPTCTSPTSPSFFELTPTPTPIPESPAISPTDMALDDGDEDMALVQTDVALADPEGLTGEMATALGGDAGIAVDEGSELSHELNDNRTTEFEKHTMQAREASRIDPETARDSGVEDLQHNPPGLKDQTAPQERDPREHMAELKPEATPSRNQTVSQEGRPEDMAEPKGEATSPRLQAAWVNDAVLAAKANKKNPLNQGNLLLVLDTTDPTKSCLLDANTLCRASGVLEKLYKDVLAKSSGCVSENGLEGMLVLVLSAASMPELVPEAIDATLESVSPQRKDSHPPSGAAKARHANAKVKKEPAQGDSPPAASDDSELPKTDWSNAYGSFFRIIAGKKHGIPKSDLSPALPHIQGVVEIAQTLDALDAVKSTFTSLLLGYVEHHKLYSTIGKWPVHCLNLGIALESRLVYDEAFKHLVGNGANFKNGKVYPGLSDYVQPVVQRRSRELYSARRDVEEKLMLITLAGTKDRSSYPSQYVSQHDQHMAYNTVNIFRDWIHEHIGLLRNEAQAEPAPFYLYDHADGCSSVAGFYQTIVDYDYLDPDEVYNGFSTHYKSARNQPTELEQVRQALGGLKDQASGYVEKLSESSLHLADKSELDYLTCVKVEPSDVPWAVESDEDSDEAEDMDEDSD